MRHTLLAMIRFRVLLIAAGYPDANDCDALRSDPAFKMALRRLPESGADLCSQPTMSRLENLPGITATPPTLAIKMAVVVVTIIPAVIVYPFVQRHFTKGVITGAIKG